MFYAVKLIITAGLIVVISEIAKRSSLLGAVLASIPLVSVLAMVWMYIETGDCAQISRLSVSIFWLVLPSLVLFVALPLLLKQGLNFYLSMSCSIALTAGCYAVLVVILRHLGLEL